MSNASMPDASEQSDDASTSRRRWSITGGLVAGLAVLAVVTYWWIIPSVADSMVRSRLQKLNESRDIHATYDDLTITGLSGVEIRGVRVATSPEGPALVQIESVRAGLKLWPLLSGTPVISSVAVDGVEAHVRPGENGHRTNVEAFLARLKGGPDDKGPKATKKSKAEQDEKNEKNKKAGGGWLRRFGGQWPDLTIAGAAIEVDASLGWPVRSVRTERLEITPEGKQARIEGAIALQTDAPGPNWQVPRSLEIAATIREDLAKSTGSVTMTPPLEVAGLGPAPYLRAGLKRVEIAADQTLHLEGITADFQAADTEASIGRVQRLTVRFGDWPTSTAEADIRKVVVTKPVVAFTIDRLGGNPVSNLLELTERTTAHHVERRARSVAEAIAEQQPTEQEKQAKTRDAKDGKTDDAKPKAKQKKKKKQPGLITRILMDPRTPEILAVEDGALHLTDHRKMNVVRPAGAIHAREGRLTLRHRPIRGGVEIEGGFRATSAADNGHEDSPRGRVTVNVDANYRHKYFQGRVLVDSLDISWLRQLLGPKTGEALRGGRVTAEIDTTRKDSGVHDYSGRLAVQDLVAEMPTVAKDTLRVGRAGYEFSGRYDPKAKVPDPTLFARSELYEPPKTPDKAPDKADAKKKKRNAHRGSVVIEKGHGWLEDVEATLRPAFHGVDGFSRLPTLMELDVELPETPVQTLYDAVPAAIRGPLEGTKMKGRFSWSFHAEVPLHNAGETEWETSPTLKDFELLKLPEDFDIRKLKDGLTHTIHDEKLKFKRRIEIEPMKPVPAQFIIDNLEAEPEVLRERREEREWPPKPRGENRPEDAPDRTAEKPWRTDQPLASPDKLDVPAGHSPLSWARELIDQGKAPDGSYPKRRRPSRENTAEESTRERPQKEPEGASLQQGSFLVKTRSKSREKTKTALDPEAKPQLRALDSSAIVTREKRERLHPYGPYVYVPLEHMSPWLPRAIMTTEDNSFFEHHGFNWYALKNSLEDNINAGGFVRGGSTVSMQLVKNLFLSFDKVLARKMREAFLVWVMEDVVDLPKARILELYFNIIEFGPGIFGIHDAAAHYFGKRPDMLTLSEIAWLVSVIPNPKEYHRYYERGEISDYWWQGMQRYIEIMHERDRVTEADVERATARRPEFYKPGDGEPKLRPNVEPPKVDPARPEQTDDGLDAAATGEPANIFDMLP